MSIMWYKLKILTPALRKMSKHLQGLKMKSGKAKQELIKDQMKLTKGRMNTEQIELVKHLTTEVLKWNELDEMDISQKAKIN